MKAPARKVYGSRSHGIVSRTVAQDGSLKRLRLKTYKVGHCAKWISEQIQMASIKCWGLHGIAMDLELCGISMLKLGIEREGPGKGIPAC